MGQFLAKDHYFHQAKRQGFRARSVFKLEEIEQKGRLINQNSLVLDLGSAPGSWLQYVAERQKGGFGKVLGVDLLPIEAIPSPQVKTLQTDALALTKAQVTEALGLSLEDFSGFDVVLSDMAPKTTGIRHVDQIRSLELAEKAFEMALLWLKPKGHVVIKIFEGPETKNLMEKLRSHFQVVKQCRPKSVRAMSKEFYAVGIHKKA